MIACLVLE